MRTFILIATLMFVINCNRAQSPANSGGIKPPDSVEESFIKKHPNVIPNWSKDQENFKATYEDPLSHTEALIIYNSKGETIRSEYEIEIPKYPRLISEYYSKNYPKEKFKLWSSIDKDGNKLYFIYRKKNIFWFDKDGNHIPLSAK